MKTSILNITGVEKLTKQEQKSIIGQGGKLSGVVCDCNGKAKNPDGSVADPSTCTIFMYCPSPFDLNP